MAFPLSGSFFSYDLIPFCRYNALKSTTLLSITSQTMTMAWLLHQSGSPDVATEKCGVATANNDLLRQMAALANKSSAVTEMADCGHNRHGPKRGGCFAPFVGAGTPSNTMWPGPRSTSVPNGVFIHLAVWPQRTLAENWGLCPFRGGEVGPHLTQCRLGRGLPPY